MKGRLGIDLSAATAALAHVSERRGQIQLRGFALVATAGDPDAIASELRHARRAYRFPRHAEVVAWPGDIRAGAVRNAGYAVERVISPAEALARVARLHHGTPAPERVSAVLSLHPDSGALAVVQDGRVLHEAALTWSAASGHASARSELLRRYAFLAELTEHLRSAFTAVQESHGVAATEILTCGTLADLRSFTMPLADEFDVEVETLDAAGALDIRMKPASAQRARDVLAALRIAIAAGRRWHRAPGVLEALRPVRVVGAIAAAAAAVLLAVYLWPRETTPRPAPEAPPTAANAPRAQPNRPQELVETAPAGRQTNPIVPAPAAPPLRGLPPPVQRARVDPPRTLRSLDRLPPLSVPVSSILWSADRQFAVVGGRILEVGDTIDGARIVEIRADALIVRDAAGRLRRAALRPVHF